MGKNAPAIRQPPRGAEPKTFDRWVRATARDGVRKFKVYVAGQKEPKLAAFRNVKATAKTILSMVPTHVEAIGDEDEILRVWQFSEDTEPAEEPGYTKEAGDSEDERLLKTFAHLLSDAYRLSTQKLVEVVSLQSAHFASERTSHTNLRILNERLMQSLAKKVARIRVATEPAEGDEEEEERAETPDNFLSELLEGALKKYAQAKVGDEVKAAVAASDAGVANGVKE